MVYSSKMKVLFYLLSCIITINLSAQDLDFPSLSDLDQVVKDQQKYTTLRENRIAEIKQELKKEGSEGQRYALKSRLFEEYLTFIVDSALSVAQDKLVSAQKLARHDLIIDSRLNIVHMLILAGMYKEASDSLKTIERSAIPAHLVGYKYSLQNTLYESMSDYTIVGEQEQAYKAKASVYKDSILRVSPNDIYVRANKLLNSDNYREALQLLLDFYRQIDPESHDVAISAYSISDIYRRQGNKEDEKKYLIVSAISDLKWGVKEYISLRRLAIILYEEGDLARAYAYMRRSLDDAAFCNARLRTIEVSQSLPIIEQAYQTRTKKQNQRTLIALIGVCILSVFLILLVLYVRNQVVKLSQIRGELNKANRQLQQLNAELNQVNEKLRSTNGQLHKTNQILSVTNQSLSEANHIKETYIVKFMTECAVYIDKMDNFRTKLNKQAISGSLDVLFKTLKSTSLIKDELEDFYITFDETFLNLFPTFVDRFNELLLSKAEKIIPKKENSLTTELRIFALIRLGITDSERIAFFLRCSKSTVYSYRSRLRLKSIFPDTFEEEIMHIASF